MTQNRTTYHSSKADCGVSPLPNAWVNRLNPQGASSALAFQPHVKLSASNTSAIFSRRPREATAASSHLFAPQAPGSPSVSGLLYFYAKGGDEILCNPPHGLPESPPIKPSAPNFQVRAYILSEHSLGKERIKIC